MKSFKINDTYRNISKSETMFLSGKRLQSPLWMLDEVEEFLGAYGLIFCKIKVKVFHFTPVAFTYQPKQER